MRSGGRNCLDCLYGICANPKVSQQVFAVASSACSEKQVKKGLGRHWNKLSSQDRIDFLKVGVDDDYTIDITR